MIFFFSKNTFTISVVCGKLLRISVVNWTKYIYMYRWVENGQTFDINLPDENLVRTVHILIKLA